MAQYKIMWLCLLIAIANVAALSESVELSGSLSQEETFSSLKCPIGNVVSNFVPEQMMGVWHEVARYSDLLEDGYMCTVGNYTDYNPMTNTFASTFHVTGAANDSTILYTTVGQFIAPGVNTLNFLTPIQYTLTALVLGMDTDSYIVFYACMNSQPAVWVFSRQPHPSDNLYVKALEILAQNNLPIQFLHFKNEASVCF